MGGVDKVKRQRDQGRLTVRERIDRIVDANSFHEVGAISGIGEYDEHGELKALTPANCVFGRGKVDGRTVVVVGDDFTVRGGSADASISAKPLMAEEMAHDFRLPIIRIIEGSGGGGSVKPIETKGAARQDGIDEGVTQIRRYHRETPEMLTAPQVFNVTHLIDFYYGVTWNLDRKDIFNWKDEEKGNFEKKVKRFFTRERFLKLLGEWIVFYTKDDELRKIVLRQHQMLAVDKIVERTLDPEKTRGLIWHTQGSGKTFTMIKAAEQILRHPAFEKPIVIGDPYSQRRRRGVASGRGSAARTR